MIRSYKIRLLPNKEQEQLMWKHVGCCRFVWNYMLALQKKRYTQKQEHLSGFDMTKVLPALKRSAEYTWLNEYSATSMRIVCRDLDKAYQSFFKKITGFPKFKSRKKSKPNFPIRADRLYFTEDNKAHIEKIGNISFKTNYDLPIGKGAKFMNPRISYANNKWLLSFGLEVENQDFELTDNPMGIDLGIKELATVEFGGECLTVHNINKSRLVRRLERKLHHLQRNVSRKYRVNGSFQKTANIIKTEEKIRRLQYHLSMIRNDHIHKSTHRLVEMLPKRVVMEDLNIAGMMKNKHLSKAIQDAKFYEFIRQTKYKCEWKGIEFVQANRFYPSSKTCSCCGVIRDKLKLSERIFKCYDCGFEIDRDYNAAINLSRYAG